MGAACNGTDWRERGNDWRHRVSVRSSFNGHGTRSGWFDGMALLAVQTWQQKKPTDPCLQLN